MSRVHDALKKAEAEKAILGDPESSVETMTPTVPGHHHPKFDGAVATAKNGTGQAELVPEAFLERCSLRDWNTNATLTQQVDERRHTLVSEEFRSLRSRLYLMRKVRPVQRLLVTSPLPQEGKTLDRKSVV